ncbi:MAG: InlB B-repeat-containing protein [archaeon]|nr:InlB B-repeat-containing protein [archaeon]
MDMKVLVLAIIAIAGIGLGITFVWTGSSQQGVDITVSCDEGVDHVTGSGIHCKDEFVDLYAEIKEGYAFLGWYDKDGKLLSDKKEYKVFTQRSTELVVKTMAGYEVTVYTMAGIDTVVGAGAHGFSEAVTLEATVKNGYTFAGWYGLDGKLLNEGPCYTYDKCADIILVAKTNEVDVGKGGIHYIWEDADVWIVTDWYTGDYVFSKTNSTFSMQILFLESTR